MARIGNPWHSMQLEVTFFSTGFDPA